MERERPDLRDPSLGFFLALLFPGLGHLYAGSVVAGAVIAGIELYLFSEDLYVAVLPIHLFQAVAAAGAVKIRNARIAAAAELVIPPPPPPGRRTVPRPAAAPPREPPPIPEPQPQGALAPDAFLEELQAAWRGHRAGELTARQFADRKWRAIRRVAPDDRDDAEALVAAAEELVGAGVMTSEELGQLKARVAP